MERTFRLRLKDWIPSQRLLVATRGGMIALKKGSLIFDSVSLVVSGSDGVYLIHRVVLRIAVI